MSHIPAIARLIAAVKDLIRSGPELGEAHTAELSASIAAFDASPSEVDEWIAWIACSERLPPDDEMVVIYTNMGNLAEDWVDKDTGDFLNYPFLDESHARSATHWRPALEPPTTKGAP